MVLKCLLGIGFVAVCAMIQNIASSTDSSICISSAADEGGSLSVSHAGGVDCEAGMILNNIKLLAFFG